jgi:creatinine amidohydrolase
LDRFFISEMTTEEVKKALEKNDMVIMPFGSTEQHSRHLPLGTDSIITYEITKKVAEKINKEFPVLVAPLVSVGKSIEHMFFDGTITFQRETLTNIVLDISRSLIKHGFKKIVLINGHGGNTRLLGDLLKDIRYETGAFVSLIDLWSPALLHDVLKKIIDIKKCEVFHAGLLETSFMMLLRPDLVHEDKIQKEPPHRFTEETGFKYHKLIGSKLGGFSWLTKDVTKSGIIGDPTKATKEIGETVLNYVVDEACNVLREVKSLKIDYK